MYNDHRDRNRDSWKFTYKGSDLVEAAKAKVEYYRRQEVSLREKLGVRLQNSNMSLNSKKSEDIKKRAFEAASFKEQCEVQAHEFNRTPDREFSLSLSDVVFFGLAGHRPFEENEESEE